MKLAFLIVAIILFVLDALFYWMPNPPGWGGRLQSLGLAFFAASFAV
jgi:hypothetical protein